MAMSYQGIRERMEVEGYKVSDDEFSQILSYAKRKAKVSGKEESYLPFLLPDLMNAEIQIGDVLNGTKTEKLGEWAEIQIGKETLKEITQEQFLEFCNDTVRDSGYNWFTISCEDGTGIQFAGSIPYVSTYGSLDNEGCITESIGTITIQEDGTYSYTETE